MLEILILGLVQGVTECLPVSSSGHLVLMQSFIGIDEPGSTIEIVLHLGTLLSILVVFYNDILNIITSIFLKETQKFILLIIISTIPVIIFGLSFKDFIYALFDSKTAVSMFLLFTGSFLLLSTFFKSRNISISYYQAILIGFAQALAIFPGISRSGMTIGLSMMLGVNPKDSARFSFFLAFPVILGATLITLLDSGGTANQIPIYILIGGFLSSFLSGIISLKILFRFLEKGNFYFFGIYCLILGLYNLI